MTGQRRLPRIAITCGRAGVPVAEGTLPSYYLGEGYPRAVADADGCPLILPPVPGFENRLAAALDGCDGLLLAGGTDIHPQTYGARSDPGRTHKPDSARDQLEIRLVREARRRRLPVLGVCRGFQLLNVAYGGTLDQHHPHTASVLSFDPRLRIEKTTVSVELGTRLAAALGTGKIVVCCLHHQAIDRVADGLAVTGRAADGLIEAVEDTTAPFIIGVAWHPEQMLGSAQARAIYRAFTDAARSRQ